MSFDLEEVYEFARKIVAQLTGNEDDNIGYAKVEGWKTHTNGVTYYQDKSLEWYARALKMAADFLLQRRRTTPVTPDEQDFMDVHTQRLIDAFVEVDFSFAIATPINSTALSTNSNTFLNSDRYLNSKEHLISITRSEQVNQPKNWAEQFRGTPAFIALEQYLTYLKNDPRKHDYVVKKDEHLGNFIDNLTRQTSMAATRQTFNAFYEGKGIADSDYAVLNTGQDRTTRFFSFFGMRTTTIELIDNLSAVLKEFENQNSDSVDCSCW